MINLPPSLQRFIFNHIGSVQELEVILLLRAWPERLWSGATVARELKRDAYSCDKCLADLVRRGFAARSSIDPDGVRYAPQPWSDQPLTLLAHLYPRHWTAVARVISSKAPADARDPK
ncbi:hypothetical protein [Pendulispora albinea]|uniref:ArsR family transcriptional regulator n=1 Tax=Pendulispora albinea TaxID=2741071 RepID=A0ABZ2LP12_9BACT